MIDRRWKHRLQVVRHFDTGASIVCCSHRWERSADICARIRDVVRRIDLVVYHDVRQTPGGAA